MMKIMTVDVETDWETEFTKSVTEVVPKILDYFQEHNIEATFFVLGKVAEKYPELIKNIAKKHEVASHGYSHKNLKNLTRKETEEEIKKSVDAFKKINIKCAGFRAPFFKKNRFVNNILKEQKFIYDCSEKGTKIYKKNKLIEIPVPNSIPFITNGLSYYRLFYPISNIFPKRNLFYLHPYEFLEKVSGNNLLLNTLGRINHGKKAWVIFDKFIKRQNTKWVSCRTYLEKNGNK